MAYSRGENYIWADETYYHFWIGQGKDVQAADMEVAAGYPDWASLKVPHQVLDDFVLARFAEMLEHEDKAGLVGDLDRLSRENRNFGVDTLRHRKEDLITILNRYGKTQPGSEPGATPNGGPAEPLGSSDASGGPPSVS